MEREMQMAQLGFMAQERIEEIRTEQVAMQTEAQMTEAALKHDQKVLEKASQWVANYVGTVRPTVTYIFVLELVGINIWLCYFLWVNPQLVSTIDDVLRYSETVFSSEEMSMLGAILGYWFGSRGWQRK
jgi:predicted PurR-regulated permease PerM